MIRRPPRSTQSRSSAASDVYKRQVPEQSKPVILPRIGSWIVVNQALVFYATLKVVLLVLKYRPHPTRTRLDEDTVNVARPQRVRVREVALQCRRTVYEPLRADPDTPARELSNPVHCLGQGSKLEFGENAFGDVGLQYLSWSLCPIDVLAENLVERAKFVSCGKAGDKIQVVAEKRKRLRQAGRTLRKKASGVQ